MRMHYRLLVTTRQAGSSFEVRRHVSAWLSRNGLLIDPDTRWSGGIADWYVIGGRWTGDLSGISDAEWRDRYRGFPLGYEDDAQLVTEALYDRFLAEYENDVADWSSFVDLEDEPVTRAFIGRKWLVVIDYHR